ncbi:hypothetical protein [Undibacterium flavidum]|uniref:Uncharacterized protein n=1 Tax=Undibacterium flavidum TaxID=2762297 RepID=A0ABR6Y7T6_9BURK|nr:hypothetical protein [Undibacterium flavidum]MBC3872681.1 hypothetical protein [Undibacterium flavidum]
MKKSKIFASFLLATHFISVYAQESTNDDKTNRVEISSYKGPELRSYAQMLKGLIAYREQHQLAPDSELYFILIPKSKNVAVQGLTMRLASDETSVNIPIDAGGKFQLPLIELKKDDEYDLILNKPKGQFYIKPYVKSANLPDDAKRLGDLRLECQVRWAIEKQDVSVVFNTYVKLLASGNPCTSRTVAVHFFAPSDAKFVTLDTAKSTFSYEIRPDKQYTLPIWDTALSDEGLVKYLRSAAEPAAIRQEN